MAYSGIPSTRICLLALCVSAPDGIHARGRLYGGTAGINWRCPRNGRIAECHASTRPDRRHVRMLPSSIPRSSTKYARGYPLTPWCLSLVIWHILQLGDPQSHILVRRVIVGRLLDWVELARCASIITDTGLVLPVAPAVSLARRVMCIANTAIAMSYL